MVKFKYVARQTIIRTYSKAYINLVL